MLCDEDEKRHEDQRGRKELRGGAKGRVTGEDGRGL